MKKRTMMALAAAMLLAQQQQAKSAEVLLYNGLLSAIPGVGYGVRQIRREMESAGIEAREFAYVTPIEGSFIAWYHARHFCNLHERGELDGPVILGGHSYGGAIIAKMARSFEVCGIRVAYMFFIDTPIIWPIGQNVELIDNFRAGISVMNGRVALKDGVDVPVNEWTYPAGHVTVSWLETVHERVVEVTGGLVEMASVGAAE